MHALQQIHPYLKLFVYDRLDLEDRLISDAERCSAKLAGCIIDINRLYKYNWINISSPKQEAAGRSLWLTLQDEKEGIQRQALLAVGPTLHENCLIDKTGKNLSDIDALNRAYHPNNNTPRFAYFRHLEILTSNENTMEENENPAFQAFSSNVVQQLKSTCMDSPMTFEEELNWFSEDVKRKSGTPLKNPIEEKCLALLHYLEQNENDVPACLRLLSTFVKPAFNLVNTTDYNLLQTISDRTLLEHLIYYARRVAYHPALTTLLRRYISTAPNDEEAYVLILKTMAEIINNTYPKHKVDSICNHQMIHDLVIGIQKEESIDPKRTRPKKK